MSLTLVIVTPEGEAARAECSHVTVYAADGADGLNGGSVGIRRGHAPALIALENNSRVIAKNGESCLEFTVAGGFAGVRNDAVTVVTESCERRE